MPLIAWAIYDDDGNPVTGATPSFIDYRDRGAIARARPVIAELGAGQYGFEAPSTDAVTGIAFLVDNGVAATPRRVSGAVCLASAPFSVWHLEDADGALWTGALPSLGGYSGINGALPSPPSIVTVSTPSAYLFSVTPAAADLASGISFRADSPAGAWPLYVQDALVASSGGIAAQPISGIRPAAAAAKALREWLLAALPAACVAVNNTRAATLRAPFPGPYVIPFGAVMNLSATTKAGNSIGIALAQGTRSAIEIANQINPTTGGWASVDSDGHLVLTSPDVPEYDTTTLAPTDSIIAVGKYDGGPNPSPNAAFGWDVAGEYSITTPIVPPGPRGVCDGMPLQGFFEPSQLGKGRVLVTIGERTFTPVDDNPRRFEWLVTLELGIFRAEPQQVVHQTREGIQAALQCVQECLMTDAGKQLGRAAFGDIQYGRLHDGRIAPFSFRAAGADGKAKPGGIFFDAVNCKYLVRVYQAPTL